MGRLQRPAQEPAPTQFWRVRIVPAIGSCSPISVVCSRLSESTVSSAAPWARSRACWVTLTLRSACISSSGGTRRQGQPGLGRAIRRAEGRMPSMVLDAMLSARPNSHSAASGPPPPERSRSWHRSVAAVTAVHVSRLRSGSHPLIGCGTYAWNTVETGSPGPAALDVYVGCPNAEPRSYPSQPPLTLPAQPTIRQSRILSHAEFAANALRRQL